MSKKYEHLEGAVPVNGDITPISRKPIDQIDSRDWEDMPFEALSEQYTMLQNRIYVVESMGRPDMLKQMKQGLAYLMQLIDTKRPKEDEMTLL